MKKTIEEAAKKYASTFYGDNPSDEINNLKWRNSQTDFKEGIKWQKEQLQPIIDSHAELLEALIKIERSLRLKNRDSIPHKMAIEAISKSQSIAK